MIDEPDPVGRLAQAERMQDAVRRHSKWYTRYLLVFGVATIPVVTWAGFLDGPVMAALFTVVWGGFLTGLSVWGNRFGVTRRGFQRTHFTWLACWFGIYCAVLVPGVTWFGHDLAWWLPGGVVTSIPCFLTAYREAKR